MHHRKCEGDTYPLGNITKQRYQKKFLWKAMMINCYWRWLEMAYWEEVKINGIWVPYRWIEPADDKWFSEH